MDFYRVVMDSIKFFYLNVFMYALFLEMYLFLYLLQDKFNVELPFINIFFGWIATFIAITVWINVAYVWYRRVPSTKELATRAVISELPFALLLVVAWIASVYSVSIRSLMVLIALFTAYLFFFPAVIVVTKSHRETAHSAK